MFSGAITALVTPMRDGQVDTGALAELVEFQISEGIDGVVACGTTGETPTLSDEEQATVIRAVVDQAKGRIPVIAGAGANSTSRAIEHSKLAAECGADALLHVTPYYNKPTQAGLIAHFTAISTAVDLPVVLYNVPGRTGCDMLPETVAKLASLPGIVAVKEASGSIARAQQVIAACDAAQGEIAVLSGDDAIAFAMTAVGGTGVISVVSNVVPKQMATLIRLTRASKLPEARQLHYQLLPLMNLMFLESNPLPVKAAVSLLGYTANSPRLPLQPLSAAKVEQVAAAMRQLGVLS